MFAAHKVAYCRRECREDCVMSKQILKTVAGGMVAAVVAAVAVVPEASNHSVALSLSEAHNVFYFPTNVITGYKLT